MHKLTCNDDEDMVLATAFLNDINSGIDDGRKRSGPSETQMRHDATVTGQSALKPFARAVIRIEAKHMPVMGGGITEAKAGDLIIIVES